MVRACVLTMMVTMALPGAAQSTRGGRNSDQSQQTQTTSSQSSQMGSLPSSSSSSTTTDPFELTGRVLNARTNAPIARALVRFGTRAVLTNHDGVYAFPQVTSTTGFLIPSKPGFYSDPSGTDSNIHSQTFVPGTPVDLLLYPEALLYGVVASQTGEGLPNFTVILRKSSWDEYGHHWTPSAVARTDSTGAYRQVVPPGDYSVQARSIGRGRREEEIYLPVSVPSDVTSIADALHLRPGDQTQVNLRPESRKAYTVSLVSDSETARGFPRMMAYNTNGLAIPVNALPDRNGEPGAASILLPNGAYKIEATMQSREGTMEGEAHVTVAGRDVTGVTMHYSQTPRIPVEVSVEPSVSTDNLTIPTARSLGLMLMSKVANSEGVEQMYAVMSGQNMPDGFAVPNGSYQMQMRSPGQWYVTAADYGGSNLLTDGLTVALGGGSRTVRVRISNQTAEASGTVTIKGQPGPAYIYMVATTPSATPVLLLRSNRDGGFDRPYLPPGGYRVLATEQKLLADPRDPATLTRYLSRVQNVTIDTGLKQTLTLDAVPVTEMTP